jgi:hypothetical protein
VTFTDNTGQIFTETIPEFLEKWKGVVLSKVKPEGAVELTEEETKEIMGAGPGEDEEGLTDDEWEELLKSLSGETSSEEGRRGGGDSSSSIVDNIIGGIYTAKISDGDGNGIPDYLEHIWLLHLIDNLDRLILGVKTSPDWYERAQDEQESREMAKSPADGGAQAPAEESQPEGQPEEEPEEESLYAYDFDDGVSPEDNSFVTESTGNGSVLLEADATYSGYSMKLHGNDSHSSITSAEKTILLDEDSTVSFYWKVSCEATYDYLKFYIDGVLQDEISGETDWEHKGYNLEAGEHILRWVYVKDSIVSSGSDCGWIDDIDIEEGTSGEYDYAITDEALVSTGDYIGVKYTGYLTNSTIFDSNEDSAELFYFTVGAGEVIEGFDDGVMGLVLGEETTLIIPPEEAYGLAGTSDHYLAGETLIFEIKVMEIDGEKYGEAAEDGGLYEFDNGVSLLDNGFVTGSTASGDVYLDSLTAYNNTGSSMSLDGNGSANSITYSEKVVNLEEAGDLSFLWKVSSEGYYDYLTFYIDGVLQDKISGETDWEYRIYNLGAGEHTLRWEYVKDGSANDGSDCGWVDEIDIYESTPDKFIVEEAEEILEGIEATKSDEEKVTQVISQFVDNIINKTRTGYTKIRSKLEALYISLGLTLTSGLAQIKTYILGQAQDIINCAAHALSNLIDTTDKIKIAAATAIFDIVNGLLLPGAQGALKTSLLAMERIGEIITESALYTLDVTVDQLKQMPTPMVAFINNIHYATITAITDSTVSLLDDAAQAATKTLAEFSSMWDGIVLTKEKLAGVIELAGEITKDIFGAGVYNEYDSLGRLIKEILEDGTVIDYTYVIDEQTGYGDVDISAIGSKKVTLPSGLIKDYTYSYYTSGENLGKLYGITGVWSDGTREYDYYYYYTNQPFEVYHSSYIYYAQNQGYEMEYESHTYYDDIEVAYSIRWPNEVAELTGIKEEGLSYYYPSLKLNIEYYRSPEGIRETYGYYDNENNTMRSYSVYNHNNGFSQSWEYDPDGKLTFEYMGAGPGYWTQIYYTYDAAGILIRIEKRECVDSVVTITVVTREMVDQEIAMHQSNITAVNTKDAEWDTAVSDYGTTYTSYDNLYAQLPAQHPFTKIALINHTTPAPVAQAIAASNQEITTLEDAIAASDIATILAHLGVVVPEVQQSIDTLDQDITDCNQDASDIEAAIDAINNYLAGAELQAAKLQATQAVSTSKGTKQAEITSLDPAIASYNQDFTDLTNEADLDGRSAGEQLQSQRSSKPAIKGSPV